MQQYPLFVIGYPRSGTTLVRALLGAHPDIHLLNEPELVRGMHVAGLTTKDSLRQTDRPSFLEALRQVGSCDRHLSTLPEAHLKSFLGDPRNLSFPQVYEFLLPRAAEFRVWGEKSLGNVFHIADLFAMYPEGRFLHVVRDPRSALLSYYRKKAAKRNVRTLECGPKAIRFFAYRSLEWCMWVGAVRASAGMLPKNRFLEIRFEDLVRDPESVLRGVCDTLEISFSPAMMEPKHRTSDPVLKTDAAYAHQKLAEPIDVTRSEASRDLPNWANGIIEARAGDMLERFGYKKTGNRGKVSQRLIALVEVLVHGRAMSSRILDVLRQRADIRIRPVYRAKLSYPRGTVVDAVVRDALVRRYNQHLSN